PNVLPWIYNLPGGVYHDFMPHPLYVLLEYTGRPKEIKVMSQSHGVLPQNIPDELRILINGEKAFGILTFSFAAQPHLHFIRIYGTKGMAEVDINTMTTVIHLLSSLPKAAQKATYNLTEAWQLFKSTVSNVINFVTGKLKPYQGMKILIHNFYDSIKNNTKPPVTKEQALLVIETMDEIFRQIDIKPLVFENIIPQTNSYPLKHDENVLVTGGTGFLGKRLVELLVKEGYPVRVLARKLSNIEPLRKLGVEVFFGDVADKDSLNAAMEGVKLVVHAAAGTSGSKKDSETGTIQGTQNVLKLCEEHKIQKLIYISSCSVYGVADYKEDQLVTEESSLEKLPLERGSYSASKQQAESFVIDAMKNMGAPVVILRPGTIYGPGGDIFTPMLGFSAMNKIFVVIGNGKFELPFVYVDNLVDAIIKTIQDDKANNQVFNIIDSERINKREYMNKLIKRLHPKAFVFYFPYKLLYFIIYAQEILCKVLKRPPFLTRYRLISSQKNISYDNSKIINTLNWSPAVTIDEALNALLEFERKG
ncbi:MAG: NAD-dependent epimerase/dehydratase family protein, partial [Nitrospirota bacterium]